MKQEKKTRVSYGWLNRFRKRKTAMLAWYVFIFMSLTALFAPYLANDQPLYAKYKGYSFYPAWRSTWIAQHVFGQSMADTIPGDIPGTQEVIRYDAASWKQKEAEKIVWPIITFSPQSIDPFNMDNISPRDKQYAPSSTGRIVELRGNKSHVLGTDALGRDVLSGLVHATGISLIIGLFSMLIAGVIGIALGSLAGYYGNHGIKINLLAWVFLIISLPAGIFYGFIARSYIITDAFSTGLGTGWLSVTLGMGIFIAVVVILTGAGQWLGKKARLQNHAFPLDGVIMRIVEWFNTIPRLLLIIALSALLEQRSITLIVLIIGFTSWTEITRFTRAEFLRIREMDYIQAAHASGISVISIIRRHMLPNALAPVLVTLVFGVASAILTESGLSFLGIGVPEEVVTWGSMLNAGSRDPDAWWLLVFPGLAIFITVMVFNVLGDGLREAMDPRTGTVLKFKRKKD